MNTPRPNSPLPGRPTADDLAGTPVCQEEANPTIRVRGSGGVKGPGRRGKRVRGGSPLASSPLPTTADLAGIPVSAEGEEDLTVRPRTPPPQQ
jgi:hypothetical protein